MTIDENVLRREEKAKLYLRALYRSYGYTPYKMSKFEEYDLYVRNKDFLISDSVITFTDTDGKLLALKPDVTLSIIKNSRDLPDVTQKMCYDENVYRISGNTHSYQEIPQVGLECIGVIDRYQQSEVLLLAAMSLASLDENYLMDLSHMGMLSGALQSVENDSELHSRILRAIGEKNADAIRAMTSDGLISDDAAQIFIFLLSCDGMLCDVLPQLERHCINDTMRHALLELQELTALLQTEEQILSHLRLDFSVVNDMNYYSGIVFQGFVPGIPTDILSGGQYDRLMKKMGRRAGGIGFAVYPEQLQRLSDTDRPFDADVLILYRDSDDMAELTRQVRSLVSAGNRVLTQRTIPEKMHFCKIYRLCEGGLELIETHD